MGGCLTSSMASRSPFSKASYSACDTNPACLDKVLESYDYESRRHMAQGGLTFMRLSLRKMLTALLPAPPSGPPAAAPPFSFAPGGILYPHHIVKQTHQGHGFEALIPMR